MDRSVAVLLPCYNEGSIIGQVINDFRCALPNATVYVYDNNSTDNTIAVAKAAGAVVKSELNVGKGNVVRRMFSDIEADIYVMADGDGTYDASAAPQLISELLENDIDMVVGSRLNSYLDDNARAGHSFGNKLLTSTVNVLFKQNHTDILSGYRVMSRRFVKSCPVLASGFEVETLLTIHSLEVRATVREIEVDYKNRDEGSVSKLRTYHDGFRILLSALYLFKDIRPFLFFSIACGACVFLGLLLGIPTIIEYMETGLVLKFPRAILATGFMILGGIALTSGLILNAVARAKREIKRLIYQQYAIK